MHEDAGFRRPRFAHQEEDRQLAQPGLLAETGSGQAQFGVAHEQSDLLFRSGRVFGGAVGVRGGLGLLALAEIEQRAESGEHKPHQQHPHDGFRRAGKMQKPGYHPADRQAGDHGDRANHVEAEIAHGSLGTSSVGNLLESFHFRS